MSANSYHDFEALALQATGQHIPVHFIVFNDQYFTYHSSRYRSPLPD